MSTPIVEALTSALRSGPISTYRQGRTDERSDVLAALRVLDEQLERKQREALAANDAALSLVIEANRGGLRLAMDAVEEWGRRVEQTMDGAG